MVESLSANTEVAVQKYKLVDLFCGCGGISRGFEWSRRFSTELGVEIQSHPANAFRANIKNAAGRSAPIIEGDISALVADRSHLWSELKKVGINAPGEIDVLAGGPPCQGFSRNGVRQYKDAGKSERFFDDPRNHLYRAFLTFVEETQPKIVLIENVREFLNFGEGKFSKDLVTRLNELGFEVSFKKICAADFGVPQMRWRVFFFAIRRDICHELGALPSFPTPLFGKKENNLSPSDNPILPYRTVADAIRDLPKPHATKSSDAIRYSSKRATSSLSQILRNPDGFVYNHFVRKLGAKQILRINAVGSGRMKMISAELQTKKFYGSAYRRLTWAAPALTITTWVYHVGSGQFAHPDEDRGITMREAARLQTFDDRFIFPPLINPVSQMIGNAVPPLLASYFAKTAERVLDDFYDQKQSDGLTDRRLNRKVARAMDSRL